MKTSRIGKIVPALALAAAIVYGVSDSFAQSGSRLNKSAQPQTTIWVDQPGEIAKIHSLLQRGKTEKAIRVARDFLAVVKGNPIQGSRFPRYFALNALCAALSTDGQLEEAALHCDTAIDMRPNRWEAINNRGTVHFLAGRYQKASDDYRRALKLEPDTGNVTFILRHNVELAESRLSDS